MKTVEDISLAGSVFALESDARQSIDAYMKKTEFALKDLQEAERNELLKDFEASIAGHLHGMGYGRDKAASKAVVERILRDMGDAGEEIKLQEGRQDGPASRWDFLKEPFTLSKQNKVIFGLCGAIAERLAIDAIWIRLLAVVLAFVTHGVFLGLYIVAGIVLSVIEDETKPRAKDLIDASSKSLKKLNASGWRGALNRAGNIFGRMLRVVFVAITAMLFVASLVLAMVWFVAMLKTPAVDMFLIGYDRSSMAYIFSVSVALIGILFTGILFKQEVFPSKKPLGPTGLIATIAVACVLITAAITSWMYLRPVVADWNNRHVVQQCVESYQQTGEPLNEEGQPLPVSAVFNAAGDIVSVAFTPCEVTFE